MKKILIALIPVAALAAGFASQASAGETCWSTAHAVCDWAYPGDGTLESEQKYSNCMIAAAPICNADQEARPTATQLKTKAERLPEPSTTLLKQYSRAKGQTLAKR
jgi:hypothetical protein